MVKAILLKASELQNTGHTESNFKVVEHRSLITPTGSSLYYRLEH